MKNNKARFRGDLQVDGAIIGRDGQPIEFGGGGSVDWAEPIPEINFAGDPSDPTSGMNIAWDEDYYGLVIQGNPGSGDAEVYLVNPDGDGQLYAHPGGLVLNDDSGYGSAVSASAFGAQGPDSHVMVRQDVIEVGVGTSILRLMPTDFQETPGHLGLAMHYDSGQGIVNPTFIRTVAPYSDTDHFAIHLDGAMHWGGGAAAPDVILERADPEWWGAPGILHVDTTPEARLAGGSAGMVFGALDQSGPSAEIYEGGMGASNPAGPSFSMDAGNTVAAVSAFGSNTYASLRTYDDPTYPQASLVLNNSGKSALSIDAGTRPTMFFITDWSTDHSNSMTMGARPGVDNFLEILGGSSGLVAHSPDGTAYKLTPPNGGGAATWVAA